jgi:hypothetical protein
VLSAPASWNSANPSLKTGNNEYDSKRAQRQEVEITRSHTKFEDFSKTTESTTSNSSVATNDSDPSHMDVDTAGIRPFGTMNASKKRKADTIDDSVQTSALSHADSDIEPSHSKGKKSKEEKKKRKKNKKKATGESKEHMKS